MPAAAQPDAAQQLEAAIHREIVAGDVTAAAAAYRAIAVENSAPRAVQARALFQLGQCQEKLGQRREAHATYARVVRDFAGEAEIAARARGRLAGWTDALPGPRNLRFEEGEPGKTPPGWFVLALEGATGSLAEVRRKGCRTEGSCAVVIAPAGEPGKAGNLMQSFSAAAYRKRTVRLRAWLRLEAAAPGDRGQMLLRVDRANGRQGFFDNMDDRPVRSAAWTACEIVAEIDADAQFLDFGVTAIGRGRVWVDDVTFEVVPEEQITAARNAIRRQYGSDSEITGFHFGGSEAVAGVKTVSTREGFAFVETFRDTWHRTADGWKMGGRVALTRTYQAPDPDAETLRDVAAGIKQFAVPLDGKGSASVTADCFAVHRAGMPASAAESVLAGDAIPMYFLDLRRVPVDSALGQWLAEAHLFQSAPATLAKACTGLIFVEATHVTQN